MSVDLNQYLDDMVGLVSLHQRDLYALPREHVESFRLNLLKKRFGYLKDRVAALKKLAEIQGVSVIESLDDAVPVLFKHTVYKSYPPAFMESGKFPALTKWLGQLTAHDLSGVKAQDVHFIDDWFRLIESSTPVKPIHTTGTSGKLSIIPRSASDVRLQQLVSSAKWQGVGSEVDNPLDEKQLSGPVPIIHPSYRHGFYASLRMLDLNVQTYSREDLCESLYDDTLSADILSLSGRVATAEAKGELAQLKIDPALLERYRTNAQRRHDKATDDAQFFDRVLAKCQGQRVILSAQSPLLYAWAKEGMRRGLKHIFARNSWLGMGGGGKGTTLPPNWRDEIEEIVGARAVESYGMSELCGIMPVCGHGHYHIPPYVLPYLLDEHSGEALPRQGTQTGRAAFMDLLVDSYWGGFITGDEITIHWDGGCACGRQGEYIGRDIQRFTDKTGEDDKLSCAGAPDAHNRAMEYLANYAAKS